MLHNMFCLGHDNQLENAGQVHLYLSFYKTQVLFVLSIESSPTSKCVEVLRKNGSGTNFPEHPFFKRVSPFPAADFKSHLDPGLPGLMDAHLIASDYK